MRGFVLPLLTSFLAAIVTSAALADCDPGTVRIPARDETERVAYRVTIPDEAEERERGLTFVTDLPRDQGMSFPFEIASEVIFWMRKTFTDASGRIRR